MKNNLDNIKLDVLGLFLAGLNNTFLALLVAVFIHGPGTISTQPEILLRASWIAENATLWKNGWLFWFAPTLSFCWSYYALGRHLNTARQWRNLAIGVALIAAAVDIVGVLINMIVLPELARELVKTISNPDPTLKVVFLSMEKIANSLTNIGGFGLYTLAGMLILPAIFATPSYPRWLAKLGATEWIISSIATILLIFAPDIAAIPLVISFILYAPWVWGSAIWIIRKEKPDKSKAQP
ncbi:MAG: hypothetical protein HN392_00040 [Anaerolineae bacterium]|jgi:hypothetical protein|nr:hypothetical protein [Anaerolineae bacterium]MBT7074398.1 hypothetical protein [Anaerolineae bacterium]MBT7783034.1 hypothetical protein [Anaerolineae bacterium]